MSYHSHRESTLFESSLNFVRSFDMYGHKVQFNFQRKGDTHKTLLGGIISMFIRCFMVGYFYILMKRMFLMERDDITSTIGSENLEVKELQNLNETKMLVYFSLQKQNNNAVSLAQMSDLR